MLKNNKRKISLFSLFSLFLQIAQNFLFVKQVKAEEVKKVQITKEEIIKDKNTNTLSFKLKIKN